jgi:hypothetical protein
VATGPRLIFWGHSTFIILRPAASTTSVKADQTAKPAKSVKHVRKNTRKHVTRVKSGRMHQAHHVKGRKVHEANGSAPAKHS